MTEDQKARARQRRRERYARNAEAEKAAARARYAADPDAARQRNLRWLAIPGNRQRKAWATKLSDLRRAGFVLDNPSLV